MTKSMSAYQNKDLFSALSELHIMDDGLLQDCLEAVEEKKVLLGDVLLERDLISEDHLGRIVGDLISFPYINLSEVVISDATLRILPERVARAQKMICFKVDGERLHVAMVDPGNKEILATLSKKSELQVVPYFTLYSSLNRGLSLYVKNVEIAFDEIIAESVREAKGNKNAEPPIIKIVDTVVEYAYRNGASDIHIELLGETTLVRFRIDGVLSDIVHLPRELVGQIVTRVKVMANLRTDEHQKAQDGKIVFNTELEKLDIRVSIAPITKGEKIVMRLLSERSRHFSLHDLGLRDEDLQKVISAYHFPHGMILSTGPTGSGKTTTLYAILKLINKREVNIMTIEDPVEYQIDNVNQIQVNQKTELTFAKGLRSIVRQDPDVILVGEIRDEETAGIAVNSAMTGHLVLSTLHTNDAATSFPRLIDMGVEPYLIASTINVVVAQRLVRKICPKCRVSQEVSYTNLDPEVRKYLKKSAKVRLYKGKGCEICRHTGYTGRIGIFEVMVMNEKLNQAILAKKNVDELSQIARQTGMRTMFEDGIIKVTEGITTVEELLRVTMD